MSPPDVGGREEILNVHAKNKPLAEDVDLKQVAQMTAAHAGAAPPCHRVDLIDEHDTGRVLLRLSKQITHRMRVSS